MDGKPPSCFDPRRPSLTSTRSAVFQAGGFVVVLVEVMRRAYLASIVPVIINAVLNEHQVVVDIVAFVGKGDFPRSRLGEKQRGKILASWVTRKMETIAQFGIRDADAADSQITEVAEPRSAVGSVRVGSSLKNVETMTAGPAQQRNYSSIPNDVSELAAPYESSILESPPLPLQDEGDTSSDIRNQRSPIRHEPTNSPGVPSDQHHHYDFDDIITPQEDHQPRGFDFSVSQASELPGQNDSKPSLSLPPVADHGDLAQEGDLWTLPSQQQARSQQQKPQSYGDGGGGRLHVANVKDDDDDQWPQEALMHMNLGGGSSNGSGGRRENRYDGSGYGAGYGSAM